MDQLIFASLSHTHYWYEVGMLKVPAVYDEYSDVSGGRYIAAEGGGGHENDMTHFFCDAERT